MAVRILPSADIDPGVEIGDGSSVWHLAQIRSGARLGRDVVVGRGAYLGTGVQVGDGCKIQNYALVYEPADLAAGVFIGPAAVLTNDQYPRAVNPDLSLKTAHDWTPVGVQVGEGAAIGARAVCVAPVRIGAWAMIGAGAVVVDDVPDHALMLGVPARQVGWVGRTGRRLDATSETTFRGPDTGDTYRLTGPGSLVLDR